MGWVCVGEVKRFEMKLITILLVIILKSAFNLNAQELKLGLPKGHYAWSSILSANFSNDGKYVLTSSNYNDTYFWNAETGKNYFQLYGHNSCAHEAIFSNNGEYIATRSCDGKVILWDKNTGDFINELQTKSPVTFFKFSPDDRYILTTYNYNMLALWDIQKNNITCKIRNQSLWFLNPVKWRKKLEKGISYREEFKMHYEKNPVFSPKCTLLSISKKNKVKIIDIKSGKLVREIKGFKRVEFNQDSSLVCLSNKNKIQLRFGFFDSLVFEVKNSNSSNSLFSENGKMLLSSWNDSMYVWDVFTGRLINSIKSPAGQVLSAKFFAGDSRIFIVCSNQNAYLFDFKNNLIVQEFPNYGFDFRQKLKIYLDWDQALFINKELQTCGYELPWPSNVSTDQRRYIVTCKDSAFNIWNSYNGSLTLHIKERTALQNLIFNPDTTKILSFSLDTNFVKIYSLENINPSLSLKPHNGGVRINKFYSKNGKTGFISSSGKGKVVFVDLLSGKIISEILQDDVFDIEANNSILMLYSQSQISLYSIDSLKNLRTFYTKKYFRGGGIIGDKYWLTKGPFTITRNLNQKKNSLPRIQFEFKLPRAIFLAYTHPFEFFKMTDFISSSYIVERDYRTTSSMVWSKTAIFRHKNVLSLDQSPNNDFLATGADDGSIKLWKRGGKYITNFSGHKLGLLDLKFSSDSQLLFSSSNDKTIRIWDINSRKCIDTLISNSLVVEIEIYENNNYLLASYDDGSIGIWDILQGKELIRSYYFNGDPDKWVHIHPSGLFDASESAMEMMYWIRGDEIIDFSQLKDRYWLPGLWSKVMLNQSLPEVGTMNNLKLYPEVKLSKIDNSKINIELKKRDGGYGEVKILLNGKEIAKDARGSNFDSDALQQELIFNFENHPFLKNGENKIEVVAYSENGIASRGVEVSLIHKEIDTIQPSLFALVIGVSDFANSSMNLKFPNTDAHAISNAIELGAKNLFNENYKIYTITSDLNTLPNKENIKNAMTEIASKAKSSDILLLYLAGHGINTNGDFYFLTADAKSANSDAYQDLQILQSTAISTSEWVEWINCIPALKQVMIIDACGSGKAVENLVSSRDIEPSQRKAIDRMKDRTGMFILSGCAADAYSYESSQYGHGILTYTLLQGMKGAALKQEEYLDVASLFNYSREVVPRLAEGIGGMQVPQMLVPKNGSFDIGQLTQNDQIKIPLMNPKIVFVRSSFQESNELEDKLNLSEFLDQRLLELSENDINSKFVFFDRRSYPDGIKITGGYQISDGSITLRFKIRSGSIVKEYTINGENTSQLIDQIIQIISK
jgi:WD40 repeat protein